MKRTLLPRLLLVPCLLCGAAAGAGQAGRKRPGRAVSGTVYFTNNTPEEKSYFVELFGGRAKRRVAAKWTEGTGDFEFRGLRPGVYYVQVSGPNICLLQYEVDASRGRPERLRVFGDADCGRSRVAGLAPRPLPRPEKR